MIGLVPGQQVLPVLRPLPSELSRCDPPSPSSTASDGGVTLRLRSLPRVNVSGGSSRPQLRRLVAEVATRGGRLALEARASGKGAGAELRVLLGLWLPGADLGAVCLSLREIDGLDVEIAMDADTHSVDCRGTSRVLLARRACDVSSVKEHRPIGFGVSDCRSLAAPPVPRPIESSVLSPTVLRTLLSIAPARVTLELSAQTLAAGDRAFLSHERELLRQSAGDDELAMMALRELDRLLISTSPLVALVALEAADADLDRLLSATIDQTGATLATVDGNLRFHADKSPIQYMIDVPGAAILAGLPSASNDLALPGIDRWSSAGSGVPWRVLPEQGLVVGEVEDRAGQLVRVLPSDRLRHLYSVGMTGTGKTTMLLNAIVQDIHDGSGIIVVDLHGDLIEQVLALVPGERLDDLIVIDPVDPIAVVGLNLLEAETELQRMFLVEELGRMMQQLFDPGHRGIVGPRFLDYLFNATHLLLSDPQRPATFLDVPTVLVDQEVRDSYLSVLTDPYCREFWTKEWSGTSDFHRSEILGWVRSKWAPFRSSIPLRRVIGQAISTVSLTDVLADRRILLVNLAKGRLGQQNARLLGYVVLTKLWSAVLERVNVVPLERHSCFLYLDEFPSLITDSLPDMLSESRKFGVGITLANQFVSQLDERMRGAILGNVGTTAAFRLGSEDARLLSGAWPGANRAEDLTCLPNHHALVALSSHGVPSPPVPVRMLPAPQGGHDARERADSARAYSRRRWARPIGEVDAEINMRWADLR